MLGIMNAGAVATRQRALDPALGKTDRGAIP
jgi:hypothetical protein